MHHRSLFIFAFLSMICIVGCGAFLGLSSDDDDTKPVVDPSQEAGREGALNNDFDAGPVIDGDVPLATYKDEVLRDGPIAYWRFEEKTGNTLVDQTTNHPGLLIADDPDAGISFDRTEALAGGDGALTLAESYGVVKNSSGLSFENNSAFTIELWIKLGLMKGAAKHILAHYSGTQGYRLVTDTVLRFERLAGMPGQSTSIAHGFETTMLTREHHIAITNSGNLMTLFVDGIVSGSGTANEPMALDDATPLTFGGRADGSERFYGALDEVAIYNKALTLERILAHIAARNRP